MKLRSRTFIQRLFRPAVIFIKFRILHVDDTSQRIARGVALGLWIAFTPLMGFHMIIALAAASLFRANKALAMGLVWLSNPFTVLPIYGSCYLVGWFIIGRSGPSSVEPEQIGELLGGLFSFPKMLSCLYATDFWKELAVVFGKIGLEITIGGFVLGTLAAIIGYFTTRWIVITHRAKSDRRRFRHLS